MSREAFLTCDDSPQWAKTDALTYICFDVVNDQRPRRSRRAFSCPCPSAPSSPFPLSLAPSLLMYPPTMHTNMLLCISIFLTYMSSSSSLLCDSNDILNWLNMEREKKTRKMAIFKVDTLIFRTIVPGSCTIYRARAILPPLSN